MNVDFLLGAPNFIHETQEIWALYGHLIILILQISLYLQVDSLNRQCFFLVFIENDPIIKILILKVNFLLITN